MGDRSGGLLLTSAWFASSLATLALAFALVCFPLAFKAIYNLELETMEEARDAKLKTEGLWQEILRERHQAQEPLNVYKRQLTDPKCLDGSEPLRAGNEFYRCAKNPCPSGYRCTQSEIPFFQICCPLVPLERPHGSGRDEFCNCNQKNTCPPGAAGDSGQDGRRGVDGQSGVPGTDGKTAEDYVREAMGCDACPGGRPGNPGVGGRPGPPGRKGRIGVPGFPAPPGRAGSPGLPGRPGKAGDNGKKGIPGRAGNPGTRSSRGRLGPRGPAGNAGGRGRIGVTGQPGGPGRAGRPGGKGIPGPYGPVGGGGGPGVPGRDGDQGQDAQYCPCPGRNQAYSNLFGGSKVIRLRTFGTKGTTS